MIKTSLKAYQSITLESKQTQWAKITRCLAKHPDGLTYDEIARKIRHEPVQVARRMAELVNGKIIVNTKQTRPTRTGRAAMVRKIK